MGNTEKNKNTLTPPFLSPLKSSLMAILLVILSVLSSPLPSLGLVSSFNPKDNFLISCGAEYPATLPDGRRFKSDPEAISFLQANDDYKVNADDGNFPSPIYPSARIFIQEAKYSFHLVQPGFHWIRLHFYPIKNSIFDLQKATFSVNTDTYVLLRSFNVNNTDKPILKEYLINTTQPQFTISFIPSKNSAAFINAIEVVSAPDDLILDSVNGFQSVYRVNSGGRPLVTDPPRRTCAYCEPYFRDKTFAKIVWVATTVLRFPRDKPRISPLVTPHAVYDSAAAMGDAGVTQPNFNATWKFDVDPNFDLLPLWNVLFALFMMYIAG
ncbi:receptor protein kinase [Spatholobus suberectus]|nr:receptor protein kinase [Spatholobus suberectus]